MIDLSVVVGCYDMARELPRTIQTLATPYQRDIADLTYEIVVVDNGSASPVNESELRQWAPNLRVVRIEDALPSPARALNQAVAATTGRYVGLCIDGARMASPRLLHYAMMALRLDDRQVVGTLGFHLGPGKQATTIPHGYNQTVEDDYLASIAWQRDGYRLFDIAAFAHSSHRGWFHPITESNAVFMARDRWNTVGGFDERFVEPGGGFVNPDLWQRLVEPPWDRPWILLGEGTFHQVHGGASTNGPHKAQVLMLEEYRRLRGANPSAPRYTPRYLGEPVPAHHVGAPPPGMPPRRQVERVGDRDFTVGLSQAGLLGIQTGTLRNRYKGLRLVQMPFDQVLFVQVLESLRPATVIEIGSLEGGSAVWLRDQCRALGLTTTVLSIDRQPPVLVEPDIQFLPGDAGNPAATFPHDLLTAAPHPWLVIEDSAHTFDATLAVMHYVHPLLRSGDHLVVQDGVLADLPGMQYEHYEDGPNRAVAAFLAEHPDDYRIDTDRCDCFGANVTSSPNGWLVRR